MRESAILRSIGITGVIMAKFVKRIPKLERLKPDQHEDLTAEFRCIVRKKGDRDKNPLLILPWGEGDETDWSERLRAFKLWAIENGYPKRCLLEMVNFRLEPDHVLDEEIIDEWKLLPSERGADPKYSRSTRVRLDPGSAEEQWITTCDLKWTTAREARSRKHIQLTPHSRRKLDMQRKISRFKALGIEQSVAEWARDPRCPISDKALKARFVEIEATRRAADADIPKGRTDEAVKAHRAAIREWYRVAIESAITTERGRWKMPPAPLWVDPD
jgi:hypothetical protein